MKLSTKGKYGVRAVFEIARNEGEGPLTIKTIAERQGISLSYLEQILYRLAKAGLIESVRGPGGGYLIGKKPAELTIGDVVRALEGPIALSHCLEPGMSGDCYQADDCVARMVWSRVGAKIEEALDSITFNDLLREYPKEKDHPGAKKKTAIAGKGAC
ncbi:MAG TPA: Rrf2 family transcriptional regulator [Nitrospirota bacterium]|nr:Rrf2 family transcriptional regulator [Nitrospirota bacterium]